MTKRITKPDGGEPGSSIYIVDLQVYTAKRSEGIPPSQARQMAACNVLSCTPEQNSQELRKHFAEALSRVQKEPGRHLVTNRVATIVNEAFGNMAPDQTSLKDLLLVGDHSLRWHPTSKDMYLFTTYDGSEYSIQKPLVHAFQRTLGCADHFGYSTIGLLRSTPELTLNWHVPELGIRVIRFVKKAFAPN